MPVYMIKPLRFPEVRDSGKAKIIYMWLKHIANVRDFVKEVNLRRGRHILVPFGHSESMLLPHNILRKPCLLQNEVLAQHMLIHDILRYYPLVTLVQCASAHKIYGPSIPVFQL